MANQPHLRPVEPPTDGEPPAGRQQPRQHASRPLPTDRMKMDLQVRVLQTLGRLSGQRKAPVNGEDLSRAVGDVAASTVGLSNRFFKDAGWLVSAGRGMYAATDELVEYTRRLAAGPTSSAVEPLAAAMRNSWFWEYLHSYLADGPLAVHEAEIMLMRQADAIGSHMPMIRNIIEWMKFVGLVVAQGDQLVMADSMATATEDAAEVPLPAAPVSAAPAPAGDLAPSKPESTGQNEELSPAPLIMFSLDVRLTVDDLAKLSPEQIRAFFEAVGTLAAVKNS